MGCPSIVNKTQIICTFHFKGFGNNDPNDPWKCVRSGKGNGVIVRGSDENSLIDIPSRTSQNIFDATPTRNDRREPSTTDRPSFLPPKETVLGNKFVL